MILLGVLGWPILTAGRRAVNKRSHFAGGDLTPPPIKISQRGYSPPLKTRTVFPPQEAGFT